MSGTQLRPALPGDRPRLEALWKQAFGDGEPLIRAFFATLYAPDRAWVAMEDGTLVSAAYLLPGVRLWAGDGQETPAAYFYALATRPDRRGRGLGRAVLAACRKQAVQRGETLCLMPGDGALRRWYAQVCGLQPLSRIRRLELPAAPAPPELDIRPLSPAAYRRRREALLAGKPHADLPEAFFRFQEALCRLSGGGLLLLAHPAGTALACAEPGTDGLALKELLCPPGAERDCLQALAGRFSTPRCAARLPAENDGDGAVMADPVPAGLEGCWWGPVFD